MGDIYATNFFPRVKSSFEFQKITHAYVSAFLGEEAAQEPATAAAVVAGGGRFLAAGGAAPRLGARGGGGGRRAVDLVEDGVRLDELVLLEDGAQDEVDDALLLLGRRRAAPGGGRRRSQHGPPRPAPARRGRRRRGRRHGRHGAAKAHRRHCKLAGWLFSRQRTQRMMRRGSVAGFSPIDFVRRREAVGRVYKRAWRLSGGWS